jgi:nucleoside-diphosphate-sugar epimerase
MSTPKISNPALPKGSTILITGANAYVGSHVVDQLLLAGYKVRGSVRDTNKHAWLLDFFNHRYSNAQGHLELVEIKMSKPPMPSTPL